MSDSVSPGNKRRLLSVLGPQFKILGLLGIVLLILAIGGTCYLSFLSKNDRPCEVRDPDRAFPPSTNPQKPRILRVDPVEFQFHKKACVIIDTAVSPVTLGKLQQELKAAEAAAATAAPSAVAEVNRAQAINAPKKAVEGPETPANTPGPSAEATQAASSAATAAQQRLLVARKALQDFTKGAVYRLYINGQPSTLTAHVEARPDPQPLPFTVQPEEDASSANASYWRNILSVPNSQGKVPIEIGLGPDDAAAPITTAPVADHSAGATSPIFFVLYTPLVMWTALAGMILVMAGFVGLAHDTALLREGRGADTAYSLSRVQMAFWLVLTASGFVYVWLVTGEYRNVFPAALFVLIGISGATAGAAEFMSDPESEAPASNGFLRDIAGGWKGGELQLHRMQVIAWTVILGLIFCWNIVGKLELTSFDANLLILAGVANGVYITLKTQEKGQDKG